MSADQILSDVTGVLADVGQSAFNKLKEKNVGGDASDSKSVVSEDRNLSVTLNDAGGCGSPALLSARERFKTATDALGLVARS